jgi:cell wall assembly regulator SMI1
MEDLVSQVIERWSRSAGARMRDGASEKDIHRAERRLGIALPEELRALYRKSDGMPGGLADTSDEHGYRFYPLHEMRRVADHSPAWVGINDLTGEAVIFGDYLQLSWALAIEIRTEPGPGCV